MVVTDYDRTFTRPDLSLADETLDIARDARAAGTFMVLATGRRLDDLDMAVLAPCFDGFVLEGGAMWGSPGDWSFPHVPNALWRAAERLAMEDYDVTHGMASFSVSADAWHHAVLRKSKMDVRRNRDRLDVTPPNVNKWTAVQALLARRGIRRANITAVGDSENDLPLFRNASLAIAVMDSEPSILQYAHLLAPKSANEGFAWAMRYLGGARE